MMGQTSSGVRPVLVDRDYSVSEFVTEICRNATYLLVMFRPSILNGVGCGTICKYGVPVQNQ